jgi:CRISPR system Cascade subunit CasC
MKTKEKSMLIEIHIIQNHAPSNLNRDDSGSPKSAIFGGYRRARISSQCLKRCYRTSRTFRDEVDTLGMHTRAMPEEIKARLLAHAETLTGDDQKGLKAKFQEWAQKSQPKLSTILGKAGTDTKAEEEEETEDQGSETEPKPEEQEEADRAEAAEVEKAPKAEKFKTAQSIFWREIELEALFNAYRRRVEWDGDVPDEMRKAFDEKGNVKAKDMVKTMEQIPDRSVGQIVKRIKQQHEQESSRLDDKYKAPSEEKADKKKEREKKIKDAKAKNVESVAKALAQLILERFDPKVILKDAGLRPDGIPVDMALFGRMVASPFMHNVEGSSQFAHAISTHEFAREFDLWTRVDDRRDKRLDFYLDAFAAEKKLESGTDGMGDAEFTSACYYTYFNVDFLALVDNLTGKALKRDLDTAKDESAARARACSAVIGLLKSAIFERPTGKFNSMATPSLPTIVLVEVRESRVPVSYADAFAKPVDPKNEETQSDTGQVKRVDLRTESARRLIQEANRVTRAFNRQAKARLFFTGGQDVGVVLENAEGAPATPVESVDKLVMELRTALACPKEKKDG